MWMENKILKNIFKGKMETDKRMELLKHLILAYCSLSLLK